MKKQMTVNLSKTLRNVLTTAVVLSGLMITSANATETKTKTESPVEVSYLGQEDDQAVFEINFDNPTEENFFVTLSDENGYTLFNGKFNDRKFSRKFKFASDEIGGMKIKMTIATKKEKKTQTFEVENVAKVVQEVVVTKVD